MLKHPHKNDTAGILEELHETGAACNEEGSLASNVVLSEIEIEREKKHEKLLQRAREILADRVHRKLSHRVRAANERKAFFLDKGKPDFFTRLPEDIFNLIFSLIDDLKTHKAFIFTCEAHYEKWKKKVRFQVLCINEVKVITKTHTIRRGLEISWWRNSDYQDLYQNKDTRFSFIAASYVNPICFERDNELQKSCGPWWGMCYLVSNRLFPFPSSEEESLLRLLARLFSPTDFDKESPLQSLVLSFTARRKVYGFLKVHLTVKELHQNINTKIKKTIAKENHDLVCLPAHYVMRVVEIDPYLKNGTQIEYYITTESKKYINPFFNPR